MKQISRKKWDQLLISVQRFNAHMKQLPQKNIPYERKLTQKMLARKQELEERNHRFDPVSGDIIDHKKGVKNHAGVPRPLARAQQIEYDRKRGAYESATYLAANRSDEEE